MVILAKQEKAMIKKPETKKPDKSLTIGFFNGLPLYTFDGEWTGHDMSAIIRGFRREYYKHLRDIRRQAINQEVTP